MSNGIERNTFGGCKQADRIATAIVDWGMAVVFHVVLLSRALIFLSDPQTVKKRPHRVRLQLYPRMYCMVYSSINRAKFPNPPGFITSYLFSTVINV